MQPPKITLKIILLSSSPRRSTQSRGCGRFLSSFRAFYLCLRFFFFPMTFLSTAFGHPADGCFLDLGVFSTSQCDHSWFTEGFISRIINFLDYLLQQEGFFLIEVQPLPPFPPLQGGFLLVKTTLKLSMSKRTTKSFGFALGVLRLAVLCLFP